MTSSTVLGLLATAALLSVLTVVAWRYRGNQGAELFALLQGVSVLWVAATVVGLTTPASPLRLRLWGLTSGLSLVVSVLWLGFILSYTGRDEWLAPRRWGVVGLPLLVGAVLYVSVPTWAPLSGDISQRTIAAGTVVAADIGPVGGALGVYLYLVFLGGLAIVVKTVLEGSSLFVGQALAFVFGSLVTIVAGALVVGGVAPDGYPLTQVALGSQSLLFAYAVFGQQLLRVTPAVAEIGEKAVFDDLDDGILVVDDGGLVVRTNPAAEDYLGDRVDPGDAVDPALDRMGIDAVGDLPTQFDHDGRTFRAEVSRVRNWQDDPIGRTIIVRDVTRRVTREQRLEVLNRVLRHNVRNEMTVVKGVAEGLRASDDGALRRDGTRIVESATDLLRISESAIEIDRLFDRGTTTEAVDLPATVEDVVASSLDDHPAATVTTSVDAVTLHTDPSILSSVLDEVLANALEHAGDAPTVTVEADRDGESVAITVADDGPGIPAAELDPIRSGEVTDLTHASGLGLWFVHWGTHTLGGRVDVTATDDGTEVTLVVPDRRPSDDGTRTEVGPDGLAA